jgi:phage terminase large subunit
MQDQQATINLTPKQTEAWELFESPKITELGYGGSAGGGKTRIGCYIAIAMAETYAGSRGAIGRKELKTLRITTLSEMFVIFNELGYKRDKDFVYDAKDNILKFGNGSQILLLDTAYSPQDPEYTRFGSLNLTWAWIEESNETPEKGKSILKTRVGRHNKFIVGDEEVTVKPFWLETFNPNKGHVHRDYYKPWKDGTMPEYRAFVRALPGDNPHLPEAYIENLKRADKVTRERLLYGNFDYDSDPTKIISYEAILDLRTNTIDARSDKFMINDIARFGGDKIVLGLFKGLELYGLCVYTYQSIEQTIERIREEAGEEQIPYSNILSDEDGVGGGVVDALKGTKGFLGNARPFDIYDTITHKFIPANYQNMRSQCYFNLSEYVNEHKIAIKITKFKSNIEGYSQEKAISDLQEELDQIKRIDNSGQNTKLAIIPKSEIKEHLGRSPDFADIMMMRMYFEFKKPVEEQRRVELKARAIINRRKMGINQYE